MRAVFMFAALSIGVFIAISLVQVVRGPTVLERLLATSLAAANSVILLVLIGFVVERPDMFVDIGLAYALLAFLFPLAFARYLAAEAQR